MENYISQIVHLPFNWNTRDTMVCRGQLLPISKYQALYVLLSNRFGGDGHETFALPDLRPWADAGPDYGKKIRREWHEDEIVPHMIIEGLFPQRE
jgi:hypothetical protein